LYEQWSVLNVNTLKYVASLQLEKGERVGVMFHDQYSTYLNFSQRKSLNTAFRWLKQREHI